MNANIFIYLFNLPIYLGYVANTKYTHIIYFKKKYCYACVITLKVNSTMTIHYIFYLGESYVKSLSRYIF
jgi:hypothetical protein